MALLLLSTKKTNVNYMNKKPLHHENKDDSKNKRALNNEVKKSIKNLTKFSADKSISIIKSKWPSNFNLTCSEIASEYLKLKKYADASIAYKVAANAVDPSDRVLVGLAISLHQIGQHQEAVSYAKRAYELEPKHLLNAKVYLDCLLLTGGASEIDKLCNSLRIIFTTDKDLQYFHAQAKRLLGDFESALILLKDLELKTNSNLFKFSIADVIGETDSLKAIEMYESLDSQKIEFSNLNKYNLSLHYLRCRNFAKGWEYFEFGLDKDMGVFGRKLPYNFKNTFRADKCKVESEKWTMICAEQGIGDQVTFLSALPDAVNEFKNVFFVCEHRMLSILKRSFPSLNLTSNGKFGDINLFETQVSGGLGYIPLGSLLERYRFSIESFNENKKAFIAVDSDMYYSYRTSLMNAAKGRRIIGISWKSKVAKNLEFVKNIDFFDWLALFDKETLIVNLQYGDTSSEQELVKNLGLEMLSFNDLDFTKNLDQWLSLSAACDGIISVSTSLVHFAGACGQRVAVVMPFKQGHWTLGLNETESIFYPRVNIFRRISDEPLTSLILNASAHLKS